MIKIFIQGIKDGEHDIDIDIPVSEVPGMFEEFFGEIHIEGKLRKFGIRYSIIAEAECKAKMICDRSLKEFIEEIPVYIQISFIAGDKATLSLNEDSETIINPEEKYIDITEEVREIFGVNLPMKRIAPEYRNKDIKDLYPEYVAGNQQTSGLIDDRWAALRNLKTN